MSLKPIRGVLDESYWAELEAWATAQAGPPPPPPPRVPHQWDETHVCRTKGGPEHEWLAKATPIEDWRRCRRCYSTGWEPTHRTVGSITYEGVMPCVCGDVRLRAEAYDRARIPDDYSTVSGMTFRDVSGWGPTMSAALRRLSSGVSRSTRGLLLFGPTGTGKSSIAAHALTQAILRGGVQGKWWAWSGLKVAAKRAMDNDRQRNLADELLVPDVLVVDEIGGGHNTDWAHGLFEECVGPRLNSKFCTILTCNLDEAAVEAQGDRVWSRIKGACEPVLVGGPDRRLKTNRGDTQ